MYNKVKKRIYKFFNSITFYMCIFLHKSKNIVIFDLDNTIADSWPSYLQNYRSNSERLKSLSIFFNMKKYIESVSKRDVAIIILTARPYWSYKITKEWLLQNGIKFSALVLVPSAMEKIELLKKIKKKVTLFDDFTYNHEKGEMKFYSNEIATIKKLDHVIFYGYEDIIKIHRGELK